MIHGVYSDRDAAVIKKKVDIYKDPITNGGTKNKRKLDLELIFATVHLVHLSDT